MLTTRDCSDLIQSLHIVDASDLSEPDHDALQVLHVFDVDHDINGGAAVGGASFDVTDIGIVIADDGGQLLEHAGAIVAKHRQLDGICGFSCRCGGFRRLGPLHGDTAVGFVHQVVHVGTTHGMHSDALAA